MPFEDKYRPCSRATHSCSRCNRTFPENDSYIQHLKHSSKHQSRNFPESCLRCVRTFTNTKALIQHLQHNSHHSSDLHYFACKGDFQNVDKLMTNYNANCCGDSHIPSNHQTGSTPMHCAAFGGHNQCLKVMLSWTAGMANVVDPKDGRTPVHLAAWKGHRSCLNLLLRYGGDLLLPDRDGVTPLDLISDHHCLLVILSHLAGKCHIILSKSSLEQCRSKGRGSFFPKM